MWTEEQRARHAPRGRRYPSDLIVAEWALIASFIPPPCSGGRGRKTDMREVMNAILYVLATGCQWRTLSEHRDPIEYCSDVRKQLESIDSADQAIAFWKRNQGTVAQLRQALPNLRTEQGEHYAKILGRLFTSCLERFAEQKVVSDRRQRRNKARVQIQKSELPIGSPRRVRDKEHLRFVAAQPCFICGRRPSQAHHLQFAQPRAMGRKTSDEWVVPLCATDHRLLHDFGAEKGWWEKKRVNPSKEAERLWMQSHDLQNSA